MLIELTYVYENWIDDLTGTLTNDLKLLFKQDLQNEGFYNLFKNVASETERKELLDSWSLLKNAPDDIRKNIEKINIVKTNLSDLVSAQKAIADEWAEVCALCSYDMEDVKKLYNSAKNSNGVLPYDKIDDAIEELEGISIPEYKSGKTLTKDDAIDYLIENGCFVKGTKVHTTNGTQPIEKLGDIDILN